MDEAIRKFFLAERLRQDLKQEDVARAGGVRQGTISKIESDPNYEPGLTVFSKAVSGLGMKLSTFFQQIENATAGSKEPALPPRPRSVPDFSAGLTASDLDRFAEKLGESLGRVLQSPIRRRSNKRRRKKKERSAVERSGFHQNASDRPRKDHHSE